MQKIFYYVIYLLEMFLKIGWFISEQQHNGAYSWNGWQTIVPLFQNVSSFGILKTVVNGHLTTKIETVCMQSWLKSVYVFKHQT